ncbi:hypothetical protein A2926_00070 [Candidatus Giovannonibacteria bacterium RIFCSPLOWO2_01_FULL_44_40]|uniref:HTH arsR-type domain-containing protein n=1 Tax=Candidatus Giovannonibacteria bacterium RIFCSPHIGHO2_01_FULL_45_23 TaxID=1798325 RepID=A0A1F5VFJ2_9BACT|nr:MAG: hypothetical protein A2834_01025 [Candidatus Giovannonibacteria bacterium RIFCSPHIGHO2_01_FULL_45_23]OGF75308.1 MAG: hypothetical protein A3C77_01235 [Candidatus Giovannonibacteria bacterium RIFCSPHIGHO2_02_FULL_45_13]OGF80378.1 MAG: hypothetical protein A2926_00070 [Candidatus Giovannonibacteria bacterium RIFCSPLOWO2_01_FULL_44_40]
MKNLERLLKALANRRRLEILKVLKKEREGELSVGEIAERIGLSFKATSRHLSILIGADILEKEQRGLRVFYKLAASDKIAKHVVAAL